MYVTLTTETMSVTNGWERIRVRDSVRDSDQIKNSVDYINNENHKRAHCQHMYIYDSD